MTIEIVDIVNVRLTAPKFIGANSEFPCEDFASFLTDLNPRQIRLQFIHNQYSTIIDMELVFDGSDSFKKSNILKQSLIRSEVFLGFDCLILKNGKNNFVENWTYLQVSIDPIYLPSGKEIAISITLLDKISDFFQKAQAMDKEVCYNLSLSRIEANLEKARLLIPAIAELENSKNNKKELSKAVQSAFDMSRNSGWSAIESICLPNNALPNDLSWVESVFSQYLNSKFPFISNFIDLSWRTVQSDGDEENLQSYFLRLRPFNFINQIFEYIFPSSSSNKILRTSSSLNKKAPNLSNQQFVFVSYSHANAEFANKLIKELELSDIMCWHDQNIGTGDLWDEELETYIRKCAVFIACVSEQYQESKYCRREIKFADLLEKNILPISPNNWVWKSGLQLMFQDLQISTIKNKRDFLVLKDKILEKSPKLIRNANKKE